MVSCTLKSATICTIFKQWCSSYWARVKLRAYPGSYMIKGCRGSYELKLDFNFKIWNKWSRKTLQIDVGLTWDEKKNCIYVVYFDQQTHAWACVRMVENNKKHSKMMKKVPFSSCVWVSTSFWESLPMTDQQTFFFVFLREPYVSFSCAWYKGAFFIIFLCFWSFSTMRRHAQACIRWSKYTAYICSFPFLIMTI